MGTFHVDCTVESITERGRTAHIAGLLVDTGSENTWVPATVLEGLGIGREKKRGRCPRRRLHRSIHDPE